MGWGGEGGGGRRERFCDNGLGMSDQTSES